MASQSNTVDRSKQHRADRIRHVLLGASLVGAPTLMVVSVLILPTVDWEDNQAVVASAASEAGAWQVGNIVGLFAFMLLVPAIIAAAELIRARFPGLALASVILVSTSAMVIVGAIFGTMMLAAAEGLDAEVIAQFWTAVDGLPAATILMPLFFTALIGYILLAYGLWRSKATAIWVPALFIASFLVTFFSGSDLVSTIANIGVAIASAGMAWAYFKGEEDPTPTVVRRERTPAAV
jgi:hypothetical protein